jgi:hypothetical protein
MQRVITRAGGKLVHSPLEPERAKGRARARTRVSARARVRDWGWAGPGNAAAAPPPNWPAPAARRRHQAREDSGWGAAAAVAAARAGTGESQSPQTAAVCALARAAPRSVPAANGERGYLRAWSQGQSSLSRTSAGRTLLAACPAPTSASVRNRSRRCAMMIASEDLKTKGCMRKTARGTGFACSAASLLPRFTAAPWAVRRARGESAAPFSTGICAA